jgi:hypothetical protein
MECVATINTCLVAHQQTCSVSLSADPDLGETTKCASELLGSYLVTCRQQIIIVGTA